MIIFYNKKLLLLLDLIFSQYIDYYGEYYTRLLLRFANFYDNVEHYYIIFLIIAS